MLRQQGESLLSEIYPVSLPRSSNTIHVTRYMVLFQGVLSHFPIDATVII